jgi:non-ribosomal peptide synthetase component F
VTVGLMEIQRRLSGTFGHLTVDGLMETMARARPSRLLHVDAPDTGRWTDRPARSLAAGELPAASHRLSRQLLTLGLRPQDRVILMLPNHTDAVIALLGIMAAGLVACPVSPVAEADEIRRAAECVGARAIVTTSRYGGFRPAERAREAAASYLGLRFLCSVDSEAPDGVASLEGWADVEVSSATLQPPQPVDAALITFERAEDGATVARVRSHAQVIADGLAVSAVASLTSRSRLLATFAPVSAAGVAGTLVAPLLSGASALLHGPFDGEVLRRQLVDAPDAILMLPAEVERQVRAFARPWQGDVIAVVRNGRTLDLPHDAVGRTLNLVAAGEAALWMLPRRPDTTTVRAPRRYTHPVSTAMPRAEPCIEAGVSARGGLALSGFCVAGSPGEAPQHAELAISARGDGPDGILIGAAGELPAVEAEGFLHSHAA